MSYTGAPSAPGRLRPAWTLVVLTTVCAELTFTAVAVPLTWLLLPLLMVMYGAGVLVLREAAVRAGAGWPSLVLLGLAYQLAEDGLGLQALTSPNMYGAAEWGWRALGVNWTYWESQVGVHVVFSVLLPIMITDLIFPAHRGRRYLRTPGFVGAGAVAVLGVLGLRVVISASEDPGYRTPWGWTAGFIVAIALLAFAALRILPLRAVPEPLPVVHVPKPAVVGTASGAATLVFLVLLLPPALRPDPVFGDSIPLSIPFAVAALVALGSGWMVLRWCSATGWSDRHRVRLAGGISVGHTAFMMPGTPVTALVGAITIALELVLLRMLGRRIEDRKSAQNPVGSGRIAR
ncbi:hypothetical protein [Nocardia sp. NPDC051750]|uniref:hypothetical protein n=1 Tax=Nocardia sp. NPDC051750 TaxID=3364325 RepID=UPI0037A915E9